MRFPGIRETAVVGVPCAHMGERVKALVVRSNSSITEAALKKHCERHLAGFKVPRVVDFIDSLPRNSRGKVVKRLLKRTGADANSFLKSA
jgi:acyl-CoA synthetase (AMP-forming)/AMP-acid ligase II